MTFQLKSCTCQEFFSAEGIKELIHEYADTNINPLVQNVDIETFFPAVVEGYTDFAEKQDTSFNLLYMENELVGLGIFYVYRHGNCPLLVADLNSIYVKPDARRKGGGTFLMDHLKLKAKEKGALGMYLSAPYGSRLAECYKRLYQPKYINFFIKF